MSNEDTANDTGDYSGQERRRGWVKLEGRLVALEQGQKYLTEKQETMNIQVGEINVGIRQIQTDLVSKVAVHDEALHWLKGKYNTSLGVSAAGGGLGVAAIIWKIVESFVKLSAKP